MKIAQIEISKFRSIENGKFYIEDIVGIVGQNNSGKTAVLRSLNSFFNPELELKHYLSGANLYSTNRAVPRIIITFRNIPNKVIYQNYINNDTIVFKQEFNKTRGRLDYYIKDNGAFIIAPDTLINELNIDVQFILIPADRNLSKNNYSILDELLKKYFSIHTARRDTLTPKVKSAYDYLNNNALNKVTKGIEGRYLANKGFDIKITTSKPITYELFLNNLEIQITEDSRDFNISECGSGIQSLVAIAIHRYLAELNHSNFIIGLEEPEINLHPQGQKELIYSLLDEVANNNIQILFTTHSTVLVDQLEHTKIILVRKIPDNQRNFKSKILQLSSNFWNQYGIQRLQYEKFHRFRNSEFFFANHVIISESPNDSELFRVLLQSKGVNIERKGISVLEISGIKSLKYAFYLLRELEIPKTLIIDKDFFFNYLNHSKATSRYANGFFKYQQAFKSDALINEILNNQADRTQIETLLKTNHSQALNLTVNYDVIVMNYNLEMDLLSSTIAQNLAYNFLNVPTEVRNTNELFVNREESLKKLDLLLHIITNIEHRNLPNSYKSLVRRIKSL